MIMKISNDENDNNDDINEIILMKIMIMKNW